MHLHLSSLPQVSVAFTARTFTKILLFFVALEPNSGLGRLSVEVSSSHTIIHSHHTHTIRHTPHTELDTHSTHTQLDTPPTQLHTHTHTQLDTHNTHTQLDTHKHTPGRIPMNE
jgi:hypothetical protein